MAAKSRSRSSATSRPTRRPTSSSPSRGKRSARSTRSPIRRRSRFRSAGAFGWSSFSSAGLRRARRRAKPEGGVAARRASTPRREGRKGTRRKGFDLGRTNAPARRRAHRHCDATPFPRCGPLRSLRLGVESVAAVAPTASPSPSPSVGDRNARERHARRATVVSARRGRGLVVERRLLEPAGKRSFLSPPFLASSRSACRPPASVPPCRRRVVLSDGLVDVPHGEAGAGSAESRPVAWRFSSRKYSGPDLPPFQTHTQCLALFASVSSVYFADFAATGLIHPNFERHQHDIRVGLLP